ncbi:serine/threonine-protein kinase GA29083-like [Teleopsis dalmanni]|uniref:serine/threonine-protein kinase GA29083-like n=1 Tax=Teleopsis dalmanni TaxID=139649 RepID=UPI0018CD4EF0|nr:serine/threonine-protein kinase GA29083-like [Teleopsis dalmanni]
MKELNHKHIIYVHEAIVECTKIYIVLEYVDGGDLFNVLDVEDSFSEKKTKIVIAQLASALKYIHSRNIVHRDIKAENILVKKNCDQNFCIKLADFGLATQATDPLYDMCGTPAYMSPETIKKVGYGVKVDVWATGILMYFILSGYLPFDNDNKGPMIAYHEIVHFEPEFSESCWPGITTEARDIIEKMLKKNPNRRLTSEEIMQHNWISIPT